MTETITIRLRRTKAEIKARAKPNINAWINRLIEEALEPKRADWEERCEEKLLMEAYNSDRRVLERGRNRVDQGDAKDQCRW